MNKKTQLVFLILLFFSFQVKAQNIAKDAATKDLQQVKTLLQKESVHAQNLSNELDRVIRRIESSIYDSISIKAFAVQLSELLRTTGDKNALVINKDQPLEKHLPFMVAPYNDSMIVALQREGIRRKGYKYLLNDTFPYLKAINRKRINYWIKLAHSPALSDGSPANFVKGVSDLIQIERQFLKLEQNLPDSLSFTFSNGKVDTTFKLKPLYRSSKWFDQCENQAFLQTIYVKKQFDLLFKVIDGSIGYVFLPEMFSKDSFPDFYRQLVRKMRSFKNKEALIIDLRSNDGQNMDLFAALMPYLVPASQTPYIYGMESVLKTSTAAQTAEAGPFPTVEKNLDDQYRGLANQFLESIPKKERVSNTQFVNQYFIYNREGADTLIQAYTKPVYVITNEKTHGSASFLAAALAGLPNVTIVGKPSLGFTYSQPTFTLEASNLVVQFSSGIVYQQNGQNFSQQGIQPKIKLPRDIQQVLGKSDSQLDNLIWIIK